MSSRKLLAHACAAVICSLGLSAQSGSAEVTDSVVSEEELVHCDAVRFKVWSTGAEIFFEAEMQTPLVQGVFTCLHVYLDADSKPKTGIDGAEIWLRASVGSRYHPNDFKPKGESAAMDLQRASLSKIIRNRRNLGSSGWLHTTVLPRPEIGEKTIRFRVSTAIVRQAGARYGSVTGVRAEVHTTCTDQPVMLRHLCNDDGVTIELDGKDNDWSHPMIAHDPPGELHKIGQFLDITKLRAEHDAKNLYACLTLAEEGFQRDHLDARDVDRVDGVTFYVEPMYPRYQAPMKMFLRFGARYFPVSGRDRISHRFGFRNPTRNWKGAVNGKTVELSVARKAGQNEFRVWAWSDLRRFDRLPDEGWLSIDWGKAQ